MILKLPFSLLCKRLKLCAFYVSIHCKSGLNNKLDAEFGLALVYQLVYLIWSISQITVGVVFIVIPNEYIV